MALLHHRATRLTNAGDRNRAAAWTPAPGLSTRTPDARSATRARPARPCARAARLGQPAVGAPLEHRDGRAGGLAHQARDRALDVQPLLAALHPRQAAWRRAGTGVSGAPLRVGAASGRRGAALGGLAPALCNAGLYNFKLRQARS